MQKDVPRLVPLLALAFVAFGGQPDATSVSGRAPGQAAVPASVSPAANPESVAPTTPNAKEILGEIPASKTNSMPTSVCFLVGNQSHFADELVELAVQRITKTEGKPIYPGARADVTFHVDDKEILAEVIVGQIMKPCWIVRFGKNLKVLSYKKSFGRG